MLLLCELNIIIINGVLKIRRMQFHRMSIRRTTFCRMSFRRQMAAPIPFVSSYPIGQIDIRRNGIRRNAG